MTVFNSITTSSEEYQKEEPFPHLVQDNFLTPQFARSLQNQILLTDPSAFDRYENPFESKYTLRNKFEFSGPLQMLFDELQSASFLEILSRICGYPLQLDTERLYWGVHLYEPGDKLDINTDAGIHPILNKKKHCTLGIYLSFDYKEEQGCHLEIWRGTSVLENPVLLEKAKSIAPIYNRMILFNCTDKAWHGNPEPLLEVEGSSTRRIFITISYLSDDESMKNTYKKAYFIKRPQDPKDPEKDRLRALRANPETCAEVYNINTVKQ